MEQYREWQTEGAKGLPLDTTDPGSKRLLQACNMTLAKSQLWSTFLEIASCLPALLGSSSRRDSAPVHQA